MSEAVPHGRLIGLYSPAPKSGKSTVAQYLTSDRGALLVKFAGPLKGMIDTLLTHLGIAREDRQRMLEGDLKEVPLDTLGVTPRSLMQTLGTEWGRGIRDSLWVDVAMKAASDFRKAGRMTVIDDVRFPNEMDAIRAAGGVVVRLERPGVTSETSHASEGALEGATFDFTLVNDGTVADLQVKVARMLEQLD